MFRRREKTPKLTCPSCGKANEVPDGPGPARCLLCNGMLPVAAGAPEPDFPDFEMAAAPAAGGGEHFDPDALVVGEPAIPQPSSND
jgi:hypothetical protein